MCFSPDAAHTLLKLYNHPSAESKRFERLLFFRQQQRARPDASTNDLLRAMIEEGLAQYEQSRPEAAALLRMRYVDGMTVEAAAERLSVSSSELYRRQSAAWTELGSTLETLEATARDAFATPVLNRLPPATYTRLIGFDRQLETLQSLLRRDEGGIAALGIYGIGGLGKTALADKLLRTAVHAADYQEFAFVTARPFGFSLQSPQQTGLTRTETLIEALARDLLGDEQMPVPFDPEKAAALIGAHLRQTETLVVLDNLETVADLERLAAVVAGWTGSAPASNSRILLTSRHRTPAPSAIYPFQLAELAPAHALTLIRDTARQGGLDHVAAADDRTLQPIIETVGGNPLALLLVTGQLHNRPLPAVIATLETQTGHFAESMYGHIFDHSLAQLDEDAKQVLTLMPLMPASGATYASLQLLAGLDDGRLGDALRRLVEMNLLSHSLTPSLADSSYRIHTLTATYLTKAIQDERGAPGQTDSQE